jgi:glycosyltransferase involved in cell wall biosynthesis
MRRKPKIALGLVEIAGYYANLAKGFTELGYECDLLMVKSHTFRYSTESKHSPVVNALLWAARVANSNHLLLPANAVIRAMVLAHAIREYDVFVFGFGGTFFRTLDLPLLKALGKKLVFVFHGSDSRPPYINGKPVRKSGGSGHRLVRRAERTRWYVKKIGEYADVIIDSPLCGHYHERPFVNWFHVGIPIAPGQVRPAASSSGDRLVVVHAASDAPSKGTPLILEAIERARHRGHAIELVNLKNRPNAEVLEALSRCDFVVDELYSDTPGAGVAYEAASFGKPTIVGGYAASEFDRWVVPAMGLPTHYCHPDQLDEAIDKLAGDAEYRTRLGASARAFIRDMCEPAQVAERIMRAVEGRDIDDWMVDPNEITYLHGAGLTETAARNAVRSVIEAGSEDGLQLSDKRSLVERFVAFSRGERATPS